MKKFVFAVVAITAIIWGANTSGALQQSSQLTDNGAAGWSIMEDGAAPGCHHPGSRPHVVRAGRDAALTPCISAGPRHPLDRLSGIARTR